MAHTQWSNDKLIAHIGRIRGQLSAAPASLERQRECGEVLQVLAACRGALDSLVAEVIERHIRDNVADPFDRPGSNRAATVDPLVEVLHSHMR